MCKSLVNLCLRAIVANFQRYYLVFLKTEDDNMKRKFQFLQKKYSFDLLRRLCVKNSLPEEFIDILVNKYLKVIYTSWFRMCSWDKVTSKISEMGSNVEKIFIDEKRYYDEFSEEEATWQDIIRYLPNLKSATFQYDCYHHHDLIFKNIALFCCDIEEIDIKIAANFDYTVSSFQGVKYLCENVTGKAVLTKLKKLCIANDFPTCMRIEDDDVKYLLKNLPSLEIFDCRKLPVVLHSLHKKDLSSLGKVKPYNITKLDLRYLEESPCFVDILRVCLSVCPYLKSVLCRLLNEAELKFFTHVSNLEELDIETGRSVSNFNVNNFLKSKGSRLTYLGIFNCTVSVSVLAESCLRLKELVLENVNWLYDDGSKPVFSSLSSVTFQHLNCATHAKISSLILSTSAGLESLSFKYCKLFTAELRAQILKCCEFYPIKKISFNSCYVEKEYLKLILVKCHNLSSLSVLGCFCGNGEKELVEFAETLSNEPEVNISN